MQRHLHIIGSIQMTVIKPTSLHLQIACLSHVDESRANKNMSHKYKQILDVLAWQLHLVCASIVIHACLLM